MGYAAYSDARDDPPLSAAATVRALSFERFALAAESTIGAARRCCRLVCGGDHPLHAHVHCRFACNPGTRERCRGCLVHAGGQSIHHTAYVSCSFQDRVLGASPRRAPLEPLGCGAFLERTQPYAVLGSSCFRIDRSRHFHTGSSNRDHGIFHLCLWMADVVREALAKAAFGERVMFVVIAWTLAD